MRESYGVEGSGLARLVRAAYDLLELITFFTAGEGKEAVARPLRRGSTAWEAAGTIHTEIQDAFVKAEAIGWQRAGRVRRLRAGPRQGAAPDRGPRLRRRRRRRDHDQGLAPSDSVQPDSRSRVLGMDEGGAFPEGRREGGPLRELLHQGLPAGRRPGDLDPPHGPQAPGRRAQCLDLVRPLRPRGRRAAGDQGDGARQRSSRRRSGSWIRVGEAEIGPGRASGSIATEALTASWDLTFSGDAEPCKYLPADWLYEAPLPRTKFVAPFPIARFGGRLEIDGEDDRARRLAGDDRPQLGQRARRALGLARGDRLRGRRRTPTSTPAPPGSSSGRWTTPWLPSGMLCSTARTTASAASARSAPPRSPPSPTACEFVLPGKDVVVRGRVSAPEEGLRRLGLRRPQGPRAQHGQLLGRPTSS